MKITKEEQFLKIIKFAPSIFVIVVSLLVILFLYFENKKREKTIFLNNLVNSLF